MKNTISIIVLTLASLVLGCGCASSGAKSASELDTLYTPRYASGFEIHAYGKSSILTIKNPWQGAVDVEMQLFLSRDGEQAPEGFEGTVVNAPLKRIVCMSSSYSAFIDALGCSETIYGVSGARYLTNSTLKARYNEGTLKDVGSDSNLNYELLASLKPDLVLIYGVAGESSVMTDKMRELNIKVAYIGDYLENSPLGKSEWIVAIGELLNRRDQAQESFAKICEEYNTVKTLANEIENRPVVMLNAPWRDTWFVPGDKSYMVRLIVDAGGKYACAGEQNEQSRPISGESAFLLASASDFWLNPNQIASISELRQLNPNFAKIPPMINNRVYNNTLRNTDEGGSDFWESGAVYPNIVLKDLIRILHPELLPDHELYYYKQLQ